LNNGDIITQNLLRTRVGVVDFTVP